MPKYLLLSLLTLAPLYAAAAQTVVEKYIPDAQRVGEGRLSYMVWDVYDARLYAPAGSWNQSKPFALSLHYLMNLDGKDIADRSVEEMRKQGFTDEVKLAAWNAEMKRIFPDVSDGTVLTGVFNPGGPTYFYRNEQKIGTIMDPAFGKYFFDIWLSEKTSEPELRQALLGMM
jgi:hypothetical protein